MSVSSVESICKPGDAMKVKCIDIDNQGQYASAVKRL